MARRGAPEKAACTAPAAACRARLESMGTTLRRTGRSSSAARRRERIAIQYRARKKEIPGVADRYDVK